MAGTVSFKVYMSTENDPSKKEVRRFGIELDVVTNFLYLREKMQNIFPALRGKRFTISWKDADGDDVIISSDEELGIALTETSSNDIRKLHVVLHSEYESNEESPNRSNTGPIHAGITCDGCDKPVQGFRYKCIQCPDYDLCLECESHGMHPEHCMIRLAVPMMWKPHYARNLSSRINRFIRKAQSHSNKEEEHKQCHMKSGRHHGKPRHTNEGPSWLDTFATYLDEWANLPGECPMKETAEEAKEEPANAQSSKPKTSRANGECPAQHIKLMQDSIPLVENFLGSLLVPLVNIQAKTDNSATPGPSTSGNNSAGNEKETSTSVETPKESAQSSKFPGEGKKLNDSSEAAAAAAAAPEVQNASAEKVSSETEGWELLNKADSPAPSISSTTSSTGAVPKQLQPFAPVEASANVQQLYPILPFEPEKQIDKTNPRPTVEKAAEPEIAVENPVYHTNPKIQKSVESMIQMGFSNEGGWLTNLLISKSGDIAAALDALSPVRH